MAAGLPEGSRVFVVELASSQRRLVAPGVRGQLAWSPDGRFIAVSGGGPGQGFVLIEPAAGSVRRVLGGGSFRASPVWISARRVAFLVEQQTRPTLVEVDPASGTRLAERPLEPLVADPRFWGVYELLPDRRGGWLALLETYESDLYLLAALPPVASGR